MTLVCSRCGTTNNPQNTYCRACGHQLGQETEGRCPQCSAANPVTNIFCDECGARLVPARPNPETKNDEASVRGLSLPSRATETDDNAPEWLASLRSSFAEEATPAEEGEQESADRPPEGTGDLPEWLQAAVAAADSQMNSELPLDENDRETPGWLQTFVEPESKGEETAGDETPEASETPEWLQAFADQETPEAEDEQTEEEDDTPAAESAPPPEVEEEVAAALPADLPDWLQREIGQAETTEEESEPEEPEVEVEDLPDWLQPDTAAEEAPETIAPPVPEWLQEDQTEEVPNAPDVMEPTEIPSWLQAMVPAEEEEESPTEPKDNAAAPETEDADDGEYPDWLLKNLESDGDAPSMSLPDSLTEERPPQPSGQRPIMATGPLSPKDLTDWLGDTAGPAEDTPEHRVIGGTGALSHTGPLVPPELPEWLAAVEDPMETGQLPDWLMEEQPSTPTGDAPQEEEPEPEEEPATPSWLVDEEITPAAQEEEDYVLDDAPDWLQQLPQDAPGLPISPAELPDWLIPASGLGAESTQTEFDIPPADALGLAQAEIPEWLQALKPAEMEVVEEEPVETEGPLEGIRGALTIAGAVTATPRSVLLPKFVITEQQQAHGRVLEQIVRAEPTSRPQKASVRRRQSWIERGLIPLLILVAVLLPPLLGTPLVAGGVTIAAPAASDTLNTIAALPASATVLVAFDYTPGSAGEMGALAVPLLNHLMERQARLVFVSTSQTGPELGQNVMSSLAETAGYVYGEDYINLGYLPGGATGLQSFASTPWDLVTGADFLSFSADPHSLPVAAGITNSLDQVDLILILTSERDDLQAWIEQVGRRPGMEAPLAAGVSASLEVWAQPYYTNEPRQLAGLVSGVPGAAQYELELTGDGSGPTVSLRNNQTVGLIVIILFIVLGLLWNVVAGLTNRRPGNG